MHFCRIILGGLFAFVSLSVAAQEKEAGFLIDYALSPRASATTFIGINRAFAGFEDRVFEKNPSSWGAGAKIALRSSELIAVWLPINYFSMLIQHEFFGHATTEYQFGGRPAFYFKNRIFDLPPPYGAGVIGVKSVGKELSSAQDLVVLLNGVGANDVFAERLALDWAKNGIVEGRLGWLYIANTMNTAGYTFASSFIDFGGGNDILHYRQTLNEFFKGKDQYKEDPFSGAYLHTAVAASLLDPLLYWSFYSLYEYARTGEDVAFPWIRIGNRFSYMPSMRTLLTPFGPEFYLNNFLKIYEHTLRASMHFGMLADHWYGGAGVEGEALRIGDLSFGGNLEVFGQPKIDLSAQLRGNPIVVAADPLFLGRLWGALGVITASYQASEPLAINLEAGYKSEGYVPGEPIAASFIIRFGAGLRL